MADNQPENGDRFERFGSNMFRWCTHTAQYTDCTTYLWLATKRSVIHGQLGIVLKYNLHTLLTSAQCSVLSALKLKLGVFFGEQALHLLSHLSSKGE